jgi:hypothetical protein
MNIICENERGSDFLSSRPCRRPRHSSRELSSDVLSTNTSCRTFNHPEPGRSLLNVGTGGIGPMATISTVLSSPINVVSVSIDTTNMCNPKVLLTFTALICLPLAADVRLNFSIVKTVDNGCPQKIGFTNTFSEVATALECESFAFQFCDCNPGNGNITYSVEIEPTSLISVTAGLTIPNAVLSALAVETL